MTKRKQDKLGMNREQFLEAFPGIEEFLIGHEENRGTFRRAVSVAFNDGRFIILVRFEHEYFIICWNPDKGEGKEEFNAPLSPEAMLALVGLYDILKDKNDREALHEMIKDTDG